MRDEVVRKTTGMMARFSSELSANFERCGILMRKQIEKFVLSKGGPWTSIAFLFSNFNNDLKTYDKPKMMLANFKSDNNVFKRYNYYIIKNKEEAKKICNLIKEWFDLNEKEDN